MKKFFILILSALLLFSSCDNSAKLKVEPKLYMFAIGLQYDQTDKINTLSARSDAKDLASQIECVVNGKMDYEIVTLTDGNEGYELHRTMESGATYDNNYGKEKISLDKLSQIINEDAFTSSPEAQDIVIFYYAGHGEKETGDLVYSYSYSDGTYNELSVRDLYDSFLTQWEGRKLVLLDSCYSGNFIEEGDLASSEHFEENSKGDSERSSFDLAESISLSFGTFTDNHSAKPDIFVISGSTKDQAAYENSSIKHGYMTYALLKYLGYDLENDEAIQTMRFDGKSITVSDIYTGIYDNYSDKRMLNLGTPSTTLSRYDMVVFNFR